MLKNPKSDVILPNEPYFSVHLWVLDDEECIGNTFIRIIFHWNLSNIQYGRHKWSKM